MYSLANSIDLDEVAHYEQSNYQIRAPDRGRFWRKENGQKCLQSQTDASRKRPLNPGLMHHEKTDASFYACSGAKRLFFKFQKDISNERNALNRTDNNPCQKLAGKIKALQSAFEVKDSAANGMSRQDLLTWMDAIRVGVHDTLWFIMSHLIKIHAVCKFSYFCCDS